MLILTVIPQFFLYISLGISFLSSSSIHKQSMALTAEEFLRLTSMQRAEDTKVRAEERASDLSEIKRMIESGVKAEVERVIEPIQVKNNERFGILEKEIGELKVLLTARPGSIISNDQPAYAHPDDSGHIGQQIPLKSDGIASTLVRAKRIISLQPIQRRKDVERQFRQHSDITSDERAMHSAVIEYVAEELKIRDSAVPKIVSIFPPANTAEYDRLYVEFENEFAADYVSSHARVLRKRDHQVSIYVPRSFQSRFQALNSYAKTIRAAPGLSSGDIKTKIKYGKSDFLLLSKPRNGRWTEVNISTLNLSPLLPSGARTSVSSVTSPPAGRDRDSPSPPPPSNKRGAQSPLERASKVTKSLENVSAVPEPSPVISTEVPTVPDPIPPIPAEVPSTPPSHAMHGEPAKLGLEGLPTSTQESGTFGQTAVSSPGLVTNKHFTFDINRRLSLPFAPAPSPQAHLN